MTLFQPLSGEGCSQIKLRPGIIQKLGKYPKMVIMDDKVRVLLLTMLLDHQGVGCKIYCPHRIRHLIKIHEKVQKVSITFQLIDKVPIKHLLETTWLNTRIIKLLECFWWLIFVTVDLINLSSLEEIFHQHHSNNQDRQIKKCIVLNYTVS